MSKQMTTYERLMLNKQDEIIKYLKVLIAQQEMQESLIAAMKDDQDDKKGPGIFKNVLGGSDLTG